jgi:hypothetical protein
MSHFTLRRVLGIDLTWAALWFAVWTAITVGLFTAYLLSAPRDVQRSHASIA